MEKVTETEMYI